MILKQMMIYKPFPTRGSDAFLKTGSSKTFFSHPFLSPYSLHWTLSFLPYSSLSTQYCVALLSYFLFFQYSISYPSLPSIFISFLSFPQPPCPFYPLSFPSQPQFPSHPLHLPPTPSLPLLSPTSPSQPPPPPRLLLPAPLETSEVIYCCFNPLFWDAVVCLWDSRGVRQISRGPLYIPPFPRRWVSGE